MSSITECNYSRIKKEREKNKTYLTVEDELMSQEFHIPNPKFINSGSSTNRRILWHTNNDKKYKIGLKYSLRAYIWWWTIFLKIHGFAVDFKNF